MQAGTLMFSEVRSALKVFLLIATFLSATAPSLSTPPAKTLSEVVSYREWVQLLQWSLAEDPLLKKLWPETERRFPKYKAHQIYLMGGALRGRMHWLETQLLKGKSPQEIRHGRLPKFVSQLRQSADVDVLDGAGIGSEVSGVVHDSLQIDPVIEVVTQDFYGHYIEMEGSTLDTLAANPWHISDPLGALKDYWCGNISFRFNQKSSAATAEMSEEGFNALGQALRFMRHRAENPTKKIHPSSWQAIERALSAERGLLRLTEEHIVGKPLLLRYNIEKRLHKLLSAYDMDLAKTLIELRQRNFLPSIAEGPFLIPMPPETDPATLYENLKKAGFSFQERLLVRRIVDFTTEERWKKFQDRLMAEKGGLIALESKTGLDDLSYFVSQYVEILQNRGSSEEAVKIRSLLPGLCTQAIRHFKEFPLFAADSINGAAAGEINGERNHAAINRSVHSLEKLGGLIKGADLAEPCRNLILQELESKNAETLPDGVPAYLIIFLKSLSPLPDAYAERLRKISSADFVNRSLKKILQEMEQQALEQGALESFGPVVERFFDLVKSPLSYQRYAAFHETDDYAALESFSQLSQQPRVKDFVARIDQIFREQILASAPDYYVLSLLLSYHQKFPLPPDISQWLLAEAKRISIIFHEESGHPDFHFLRVFFRCSGSQAFAPEVKRFWEYVAQERSAGRHFDSELWQYGLWSLGEQKDPGVAATVTSLIQSEVDRGAQGDLYAIERWIVHVAKVTPVRVRVSLASYLEIAALGEHKESEDNLPYKAREIYRAFPQLVVTDLNDPINASFGRLRLSKLRGLESVKEALGLLGISWAELERRVDSEVVGGKADEARTCEEAVKK